jgi:hypothetical protein
MGTDSETKDAIRTAADVTADHLGRIASIVAAAARDIVVEIRDWVDDMASTRPATAETAASATAAPGTAATGAPGVRPEGAEPAS